MSPQSAVVMEKEEKARNAKLKPKRRRLRPEGKHTHEYFCFCCGDGGELVMCDRKDCPKAYHLLCLNLNKPPYGNGKSVCTQFVFGKVKWPVMGLPEYSTPKVSVKISRAIFGVCVC